MQIKEILERAPRPNKSKIRVGRGMGSGKGKTCGRGHKGQKSRSGNKQKLGFEGGQMPLIRRIPKRGFNNSFSKQYQVVNIGQLNRFKKTDTVTPEELFKKGLIKKRLMPVKVLGNGELKKSITIKTHKISKTARGKIEATEGKVELI